MTQPSAEILCNLCNSVFLAYEQVRLEPEAKLRWCAELNKLLGVIDFKVDFEKRTLSYAVNIEDIVFTTAEFAREYYKHFFTKTPFKCSDFDVQCMEEILNRNFNIAGSLGAVLDCIGYIAVKENERWRLRWYCRNEADLTYKYCQEKLR